VLRGLLKLFPKQLELNFQIFYFLFQFADAIQFRLDFGFCNRDIARKQMGESNFLLPGLASKPPNKRQIS